MIQDIASIAVTAGVVLALVGLLQARRQRRREFERFYVERYWRIMDDLSLPALQGRKSEDEADSDLKVALSYLLLCEDELEVHDAGWVHDKTWKIWAQGICLAVRKSPFAEGLDEIEHRDGGKEQFSLLWEFTEPIRRLRDDEPIEVLGSHEVPVVACGDARCDIGECRLFHRGPLKYWLLGGP
jgi:hypothetical protein